ncbi:MAG: lipopolysaccharide kinase InaA family protein [Pseudomonadales bacterium]
MDVLDSRTLIQAQRDVPLPFAIQAVATDVGETSQGEKCVEKDQTIDIEFYRILRLLPGKRIVGLARCGDQDILVKIFLGRQAKRHAGKERRGLQSISQAGVRSPEFYWQASFVDGHGEALATQYLANATSLQDRWDAAKEDDERVDVLTRAMIIIAKLHNQGVVQKDIHLANFLMNDGRIYTIDGGEVVRKSTPPLPEAASLENLSWFFAQFFPRFDELVQVVMPAYDAVRGWHADPARVIELHAQILRSRDSRKQYYLEKAFRDCTRFHCEKSFSRYLVCERSEYNDEMRQLLAAPDKYIESGEILKAGNSATVAKVRLGQRDLVIKRYNIKNLGHGITRAFRKSRAWNSWENSYHMEFLGIPSLKPLAMMESRLGPLRGKAYFITEYIEGPDALNYLRGAKNPNGEPEALANLLQYLSTSQISHGDLKATNFLMAQDGPVIIDLDAMRQLKDPEQFEKAFNKDLDRFMKNWEDNPELASRFEGLLKFPRG